MNEYQEHVQTELCFFIIYSTGNVKISIKCVKLNECKKKILVVKPFLSRMIHVYMLTDFCFFNISIQCLLISGLLAIELDKRIIK